MPPADSTSEVARTAPANRLPVAIIRSCLRPDNFFVRNGRSRSFTSARATSHAGAAVTVCHFRDA
jgi:hypothetical protein